MIIRQAAPEDVPAILELRRERREWLQEMGTDQWSVGLTDDGFVERVIQSVNDGATWVADDDGEVLACIAIDQWTNPGLWSADEIANAVIVHRMITRRSAAGREIGSMLLAYADRVAIAAGRKWIRLDAWTTNAGLHRYYRDRGFRFVRTVPDHVSKSTALFEREAAVIVASTVKQNSDPATGIAGDPAGNTTPPHHVHVIDGLLVQRPPALGSHSWLEVSANTTWRMWWEQNAWRIARPGTGGRNATFARDLSNYCEVLAWPDGPELDQSSEYLLRHRDGDTCEVELVVHTP